VVAILATLAVLMLWNRVRGPLVVKGLSRLGLLLVGYLTTAVAILVSVNITYGGLVVSVSDLFADLNPPMGQFQHRHGPCGGEGAQAQAKAAAKAPAPPPGLVQSMQTAPPYGLSYGPPCTHDPSAAAVPAQAAKEARQ
jgi:hypothetical protein